MEFWTTYASTVWNDGLLLFKLWDAVHEGDGPRLLCCWKLMMLYWRHAGHTKYALEAVHLLWAIQATASPRVTHELTWCISLTTVVGLETIFQLIFTWSIWIGLLKTTWVTQVPTYLSLVLSEQVNLYMHYYKYLRSLIIHLCHSITQNGSMGRTWRSFLTTHHMSLIISQVAAMLHSRPSSHT